MPRVVIYFLLHGYNEHLKYLFNQNTFRVWNIYD